MSALSFDYRAMDRAGREARGTVTAGDRDQAFRLVVESGLTPLSIKAARPDRRSSRGRVRLREISQFTYQLQVLLEARIPIGDGIAGLAQQESNERFRRVLLDIATQVEAGHTIASAMERHRKVFGDVYVETVAAAEQSGTIIKTLDHLCEALERMESARRQVVGALLYPACIMVTLFLASSFLITYTIPKFATMFASRGIQLPLLTRALAGLGNSVQAYWWAYLAVIFGTIVTARVLVSRRPLVIEQLLHRIPAVGAVMTGLAMARFSRVLSVSLSAGLGLLDALEMSKRAAAREMLSRDVNHLGNQVRVGRRLADGLAEAGYIPSFARRMLTAGEQSGELVRMCSVVARHYERETEHRVKALTTVLEPVLVVTIAGVVLVVALAIFLPMWNMVQLMS
jgi:type II secretory pathway component PulF